MALTEYSTRVRDALVEPFPDFAPHMRITDDGTHIEIHYPHRLSRFDLLVSTDRDELTIFFDKDHHHIATRGKSLDEDITEAKRFLAGLLSGSLLLCKDARWGTWHFYHPELSGYDPDEKLTFSTWRELAI
jgi:hypothetical protein